MANLGFYSRHLTEDDVQLITANTRKLIFNNTQVSIALSLIMMNMNNMFLGGWRW